MGLTMKILSFICLLHILVHTTYGPDNEGSTSAAKGKSIATAENDERTYEQCIQDVKSVFIRKTPKENFLFALKHLNEDIFKANPTSDEANYFQKLISRIDWDTFTKTILNIADYCRKLYLYVIKTDPPTEAEITQFMRLSNMCAYAFTTCSFNHRTQQRELFVHFYKKEIVNNLYVIHIKDPNDILHKDAIEKVEGLFEHYILSATDNLPDDQFQSIEEHCSQYKKQSEILQLEAGSSA